MEAYRGSAPMYFFLLVNNPTEDFKTALPSNYSFDPNFKVKYDGTEFCLKDILEEDFYHVGISDSE